MRRRACWGSTPGRASKVASKKLLSDSGWLRSSPWHAASGDGGPSKKESMKVNTLSLVRVHISETCSAAQAMNLMKALVVQKNMTAGIQKKDVKNRKMQPRISITRPQHVLCKEIRRFCAASASDARSRVYGSMDAWDRFDMEREKPLFDGRGSSSSHLWGQDSVYDDISWPSSPGMSLVCVVDPGQVSSAFVDSSLSQSCSCVSPLHCSQQSQ
jgi:hypothetical protein